MALAHTESLLVLSQPQRAKKPRQSPGQDGGREAAPSSAVAVNCHHLLPSLGLTRDSGPFTEGRRKTSK